MQGHRACSVRTGPHGGIRDEPPGQPECAHFTEHAFFAGSARFPTAAVVTEVIGALSAVVDTVTHRDHTPFPFGGRGGARTPRRPTGRRTGSAWSGSWRVSPSTGAPRPDVPPCAIRTSSTGHCRGCWAVPVAAGCLLRSP
ncbi:insulinase family protein [Streptomyces sp. NPDC047072]|uniref:insulinase family protein n=1 Tax=Streptomyces sp. NPDC047072 TaxID=3154809 RepID=UPI0033CBB33A